MRKTTHHASHIGIVRTAATLRGSPIDVLRGILDVASFAMDAILRVDMETRIVAMAISDNLIDSGRAIALFWGIIVGEVVADSDVAIFQHQMHRLVFRVIDPG